jgi:hypothetical protein
MHTLIGVCLDRRNANKGIEKKQQLDVEFLLKQRKGKT